MGNEFLKFSTTCGNLNKLKVTKEPYDGRKEQWNFYRRTKAYPLKKLGGLRRWSSEARKFGRSLANELIKVHFVSEFTNLC